MAGHSKWSKVKHIKGVVDVKRRMIFRAVDAATDNEVVEAEHHRVRAKPPDIGPCVRNAVLHPAIERNDIRPDIADKLPVAGDGQGIRANPKGGVIFHCRVVIIAAEIEIEGIADVDLQPAIACDIFKAIAFGSARQCRYSLGIDI